MNKKKNKNNKDDKNSKIINLDEELKINLEKINNNLQSNNLQNKNINKNYNQFLYSSSDEDDDDDDDNDEENNNKDDKNLDEENNDDVELDNDDIEDDDIKLDKEDDKEIDKEDEIEKIVDKQFDLKVINKNDNKQKDSQSKNHLNIDDNILKNNKIKESFNNKKQNKKVNNDIKIKNNLKNLTTIYSEKVIVEVNGKKIIEESDIAINANTKYFVLGINGVGKTTLLKYIYNKLINNYDILMIDQNIEIDNDKQLISDFILNANNILYEKFKKMKDLEIKVDNDNITDEENEEYIKLIEYLFENSWDAYEAESKKILNGLGFLKIEENVSVLSGGWRMRLALGKALLRKPEILILDEPTNHLDLGAVVWLTDYLLNYKKTLIIITHQINLVNTISDVIWYIGNLDLKGNKVFTINGKYYNLLKFIDQQEKEVNNNWEKYQKKIEELRKKSTPKKDIEEFVKKNNIPRPNKPYVVKITFDEVVRLSTKNIIDFTDVYFNYENKIIFENLTISLGMGSRIILVGDNGVGKTTFFKLASEIIKPTLGNINYDNRLRVGYYNQQVVENLPLKLNPIEYLKNINSKLDEGSCRCILGKLGIKRTDSLDLPKNIIENLSGGQKARVSFAQVQMLNPHLILLDEPTNHLDIESIEGLISGINEFNGGIVIITHDMYLIESIENAEIYEVKNKNIIKFNGNFDEYCDKIISNNI